MVPRLPVLGARITIRKKGRADRFIYTVLAVLAIPIVMPIPLLLGPFPWWGNLALSVAVTALVVTCALRSIHRVVEFYEHAAVERMFSRVRVFRYDEARGLDLEVVRMHVNSFYAGSIVRARLTMRDGRTLRIVSMYEGQDDPIHIVPERIAAAGRGGPQDEGAAGEAAPTKKRYYVQALFEERGPYTIRQLRGALADEELTGATLVRAEDELDARPLRVLLRQRSGATSRR